MDPVTAALITAIIQYGTPAVIEAIRTIQKPADQITKEDIAAVCCHLKDPESYVEG